ncbi:hypothetical protein LMH87_002826 [Akanthomyces muscarius]|uniref:Uncharacterized protein n=1 Tax=Akanthomyces muscarius TaxID=2231603 RepID=A0A9W8QAB7_AKAMU|nr:hypothetical protein LMH87_002826 [Akanthomyces muscarius]KAJ4148351.1 hypothetical protein LMH87_002826 [Akanthomyces muscarius]
MDSMRILDQHIDRSMWPIEPAEAAKYQFIWTTTAPRSHRAEAADCCSRRRRPREDDECTLTSASTESREGNKKGAATAQNGSGLLQACWRSVKAPRKQMKRLLSTKEKAAAGEKTQKHDGERRWSETTLVESPSCPAERKEAEK